MKAEANNIDKRIIGMVAAGFMVMLLIFGAMVSPAYASERSGINLQASKLTVQGIVTIPSVVDLLHIPRVYKYNELKTASCQP